MPIDPLGHVKSMLVAVDGSPSSYNALAIACDIARRNKATVSVLHVIEVPRSLPLHADLGPEVERGESLLTRAAELADEHALQLEGEPSQARPAGPAAPLPVRNPGRAGPRVP